MHLELSLPSCAENDDILTCIGGTLKQPQLQIKDVIFFVILDQMSAYLKLFDASHVLDFLESRMPYDTCFGN